jgi:hypothetical protein
VLTLVANSKMGAMNLFTPASEEQRNRVNAYAETPTSVDESRLERIRHQCQHSCYQPQSSYISLQASWICCCQGTEDRTFPDLQGVRNF